MGAESMNAGCRPARQEEGSLMPLVLAALVFGQLAMAATLMKSKQAAGTTASAVSHGEEEEEEVDDLETAIWPLEAQTINLADGDRYVRVGLSLAFQFDAVDAAHFQHTLMAMSGEEKELPEPPEAEGKPSKKEPGKKVRRLLHLLATQEARLNDAVIRELSARKFSQLLANQDKEILKQALIKRLDEVLTESGTPLHDIYFSEFVMQ